MYEDRDYQLALELQKKWNDGNSDNDIEEICETSPPKKKQSKYRSNLDEDYLNRTQNLVHPQWETLDPTPDSHALFRAFDDKFFQKKLRCVTLEWSKRMYTCAGICYSRRNGLGMSITIRLSEPLLKLRTRKNLIETMLHEMIHAYCFVLGIREGNGGHGPNFKKIMQGINKVAGTNITVYHSFHDEVNVYKTHWWRCNGICQHRSPFFGYVKRTSNRAPGPNDIWWSQHLNSCGGTFMKIKEPEKPAKKTKKQPKAIEANKVRSKENSSGSDLRKFFPPTGGAPKRTGPVKSNGGGTLLLNPKTKTVTPTETNRPKVTTPSSTRTSGNLANVVGFKDLGDGESPRPAPPAVRDFSMSGRGYSLSNTNNTNVSDSVDRNHLRDVWLKRFQSSQTSTPKKEPQTKDKVEVSGDNKRRRLSTSGDTEVTFVADEATKKPDWVVIDDDVMVKDVKNAVIAISSSEDESEPEESATSPRKKMTFADADERQKQIKKEILDESLQFSNGDDDEINLIDDEYTDDVLSTSVDLADTSLVDDLFGEDTLLKDFKRENAVIPSCSRYPDDPRNDIITCPICQEKMKRENFSDHLDGCIGITEKIEMPKFNKTKPIKKKTKSPKKKLTPTAEEREILRSAGYREEDLLGIINQEEASTSASTNETLSDDDPNLSDRKNRSIGLYTQTRPCPSCCQEVDIDRINEHLDECLDN